MRDTTKLHPDLQKKVPEFLEKCEKNELHVRITECVRTAAEQDGLYAQGRTVPGVIITYARGSSYASMHQFGCAFDFCRNDGRGAYYNDDGFFEKVGAIGKSLGLEWGGDWENPVDRPHLQLPDWGSTTARLRAQYGTPENFRKTWEKVDIPNFGDLSDDVLEDMLEFRSAVKALQVAVSQESGLKLQKTGFPDKLLLEACPVIKTGSAGYPKTIIAMKKLLRCHGIKVNVTGDFGRGVQKDIIDFKLEHGVDSTTASTGRAFWKKLLLM